MGRGKVTWFNKFFNRRNDAEYKLIKSEIPFSTLTRWYLYDLSLEDPNELAVALGLNPVSDEGDEKEVEDSAIRLARLDAMLPYLDIISELNAKIITTTQLLELGKEGSTDDLENDVAIMKDLYHVVGFSALVSAFSSGMELGILYPNATSIGSFFKEVKDE
jgi:hypothetical protein